MIGCFNVLRLLGYVGANDVDDRRIRFRIHPEDPFEKWRWEYAALRERVAHCQYAPDVMAVLLSQVGVEIALKRGLLNPGFSVFGFAVHNVVRGLMMVQPKEVETQGIVNMFDHYARLATVLRTHNEAWVWVHDVVEGAGLGGEEGDKTVINTVNHPGEVTVDNWGIYGQPLLLRRPKWLRSRKQFGWEVWDVRGLVGEDGVMLRPYRLEVRGGHDVTEAELDLMSSDERVLWPYEEGTGVYRYIDNEGRDFIPVVFYHSVTGSAAGPECENKYATLHNHGLLAASINVAIEQHTARYMMRDVGWTRVAAINLEQDGGKENLAGSSRFAGDQSGVGWNPKTSGVFRGGSDGDPAGYVSFKTQIGNAPDSGKIVVIPEPTNIETYMNAIVETIRLALAQAGLMGLLKAIGAGVEAAEAIELRRRVVDDVVSGMPGLNVGHRHYIRMVEVVGKLPRGSIEIEMMEPEASVSERREMREQEAHDLERGLKTRTGVWLARGKTQEEAESLIDDTPERPLVGHANLLRDLVISTGKGEVNPEQVRSLVELLIGPEQADLFVSRLVEGEKDAGDTEDTEDLDNGQGDQNEVKVRTNGRIDQKP